MLIATSLIQMNSVVCFKTNIFFYADQLELAGQVTTGKSYSQTTVLSLATLAAKPFTI